MSIARHHAEWLSLLDISGPFLSMPVLSNTFQQGLNEPDSDLTRTLRLAYNEWLNDAGSLTPDLALHHAWVRWVLSAVLKMRPSVIQTEPSISVSISEYDEVLRPDFAIVEPDNPQRPRLLVWAVPPGQDLEKSLRGARWKTSPATRMMTLLHASEVRLGLLTNGEQWMLVDAPKGETTGFISWYARLWLEEPLTLWAFRTLLEERRFFGVPDDLTLEALLAKSVHNQQEVTDQLGFQVRRAVEVLLQAFDLADLDHGRTLLTDVSNERLYEAALTVMMRLVVLLCAEERDLLLLDDPIYDQNYAVSTLRGQLREMADQHSEELLERRFDAWGRLLATFRAVHGGIWHDRLTLPAYGGSLFDPHRFPFLETIRVNSRTVLHLLEALQILQVKVPGGGPAEARRLSFRSLDIEQIGHVYEGLLDHTAVRATSTVLGLEGTKDHEPEIVLEELEKKRQHDTDALIAFLKSQTGRSESGLRRDLEATPDYHRSGQFRVACGNNESLKQRVLPFAGLLRDDDYGRPWIVQEGSVYVTSGTQRRTSGTHYTPRSLTESIVLHTLEPLVYHGPAQGLPREQWQLRSSQELLDLNVCDMAMGSGAFLVQACRYLAERLLEAEEHETTANALSQPDQPNDHSPDHDALIHALRRIADRCLYGVDKNPLAVEMAKLSLWLVTMQKGRPFTFLDHALKCGDSLLGVTVDHIQRWSLADQAAPQQQTFLTEPISRALKRSLRLRSEIQVLLVDVVRDAEVKANKLQHANEGMALVKLAADLLIAAELHPNSKQREQLRNDLQVRMSLLAESYDDIHAGRFTPQGEQPGRTAFAHLRAEADHLLGSLRPFHWQLEFPEIFMEKNTGFAAIVGNPPFMGGSRITGVLGTPYRNYLVTHLAGGKRGSADLSAYFFLRGRNLLRHGGGMGLLATNTIAQGDTREVGLDQMGNSGFSILRAVPSRKWPGTAAVEVAHVWLRRGPWNGDYYLDDMPVSGITPYLTIPGKATGNPFRLIANSGKSFNGAKIYGQGFVLEPEEAQALIAKDPRNRDVLFPYLNGQDLNSRPDQSPSRWVINFFDWPLEQAEQYPDCMAIVREKVKPERQKLIGRNSIGTRRGTNWWLYGSDAKSLYATIAGMERVLLVAQTSRTLAFAFAPTGQVFAMMTIVFPFDENWALALMQSSIHETWARNYSSSLKSDMQYTPSDCFQNFPFPSESSSLEAIGEEYHEHRWQVMQARGEGLTKTYNRFHNAEEKGEDIARLRRLHVEMDEGVAAAYGWEDVDLGHGFHETKEGMRYTIRETARRELLDRLLALNHERYAEEVAAGLHEKKKGPGKAKKGRRKSKGGEAEQGNLL